MSDVTAELEILSDLVAIPSIPGQANQDWLDYVMARLTGVGARMTVVASPDGASRGLIAGIGPDVPGGLVLSGHMDVVSVEGQDWTSDAFTLRRCGTRVFGRGVADMKGFDACAIAALEYAATQDLQVPLYLAFSGDEETTCLSAVSLSRHIAEELPPVRGVLVGEPTGLVPANRQRSSYTYEVRVTGRAAHAGQPELGVSATAVAARLITWLDDRSGVADDPDATTFSAGTLHGGIASNIIAANCVFEWDIRLSTQDSLAKVLADAHAEAERLMRAAPGAEISITETADFPGFFTGPEAEFAKACLVASKADHMDLFPAGSEAGIFQTAGMQTMIMGPGYTAQAHIPDEFVEMAQLAGCATQLRRLIGV